MTQAVSGEEQEGGGQDLTAVRRALLLAVWLPFAAYAFGPWSPGATGDPKDIELVTHLCEFHFFFVSMVLGGCTIRSFQ